MFDGGGIADLDDVQRSLRAKIKDGITPGVKRVHKCRKASGISGSWNCMLEIRSSQSLFYDLDYKTLLLASFPRRIRDHMQCLRAR